MNKWTRLSGTVLILFLFLWFTPAPAAVDGSTEADRVYVNGNIYTVDAEFSTAKEYRVPLDHWGEERLYVDPLGRHPQGQAYRRRWIAAKRQVLLETEKSKAAG